MKSAVRQRARELGFDDCRVTSAHALESASRFTQWLAEGRHGEMAYLERTAPKRVDPQQVLAGARSVITLAASYHDPQAQSGRIARYARYRDYHDVLGERLKQLAEFVNKLGGEGTRSLWYVDTGPLLERELAQRAGLGFIGKHTNLISRQLGNWTLLSEIITTLDLEPDAPERNHCGSCTRCIAACPTAAITAPFQLDARRCISYLTIELKGSIPVELRPAIGDRIFGCDDCLEVCPWNRFAQQSPVRHFQRRESPPLTDYLSWDELKFREYFRGTPIFRIKRRRFLRNGCVVLGNIGDQSALPALERACHDAEPMVVEHAAWAIEQLQHRR